MLLLYQGGNQREKAREKNLKKNNKAAKAAKKEDGVSFKKRAERYYSFVVCVLSSIGNHFIKKVVTAF